MKLHKWCEACGGGFEVFPSLSRIRCCSRACAATLREGKPCKEGCECNRHSEELNYFSWHKRLNRKLLPRKGQCACGYIGNNTDQSYIGDDPRGWEPDASKYIEECSSCNVSRASAKMSASAKRRVERDGLAHLWKASKMGHEARWGVG